jgi:hypothetical protein
LTQHSLAAPTPGSHPDSLRDGSHDFDFNIGKWHTHIQRLTNALSGEAPKWVILEGTVTVKKVWDGRAQLEEIEADGPKGHWEGMTVFLYNPGSHQWTQNFSGASDGTMENPNYGEFHDGIGYFYGQDVSDGRTILVRGIWSKITADGHEYEQSFSNDGGKTWEPNFIGTLTRDTTPDAPPAPQPASAVQNGQHDFDFDFGNWNTHTTRLIDPLTGSKTWITLDGVTRVRKVWDGRANMAEYKADGPKGHVELISLRLYRPDAQEWTLNFATPKGGAFGIPLIGKFKDGHGVFIDQETYNGKTILVKFTFTPISATKARSEQAFSGDGGKTWETNWINEYTRAN